jgi:hypothetical protein
MTDPIPNWSKLPFNAHFLPGHSWYRMDRCRHKAFLLKFVRDRRPGDG